MSFNSEPPGEPIGEVAYGRANFLRNTKPRRMRPVPKNEMAVGSGVEVTGVVVPLPTGPVQFCVTVALQPLTSAAKKVGTYTPLPVLPWSTSLRVRLPDADRTVNMRVFVALLLL